MTRRYSIWGREHGSDHDVELAQVDTDPQPVLRALAQKTLKVRHSMFLSSGARTTKMPKYTWLRIVDNDDGAKA